MRVLQAPEARLTWFLPPHSPPGGFAPKAVASPLLPLSSGATGRTDLHLSRTMLTGGFRLLTWIVLPATGIDFQPQTHASSCYYYSASAREIQKNIGKGKRGYSPLYVEL